jgi:hypothetical protein
LELAFRNDPLVDLKILATEFAQSEELESLMLEAALGIAPDRRLRARLNVIRLLTRLFYGCIVLDSRGGASLCAQQAVGAALNPLVSETRSLKADWPPTPQTRPMRSRVCRSRCFSMASTRPASGTT